MGEREEGEREEERGRKGVRVGEREEERVRKGVRVGERERDDDNEEGKECCYTFQPNRPTT